MQNIEVKVSREWNKREIQTVVRATDKELAITMPLDQFIVTLCALSAEKLPLLSTRAQVKARTLQSATELVSQMKETARAVMSPVVKS